MPWLMPSFGRPAAPGKLLGAPGGAPTDVAVLVNADDPQRVAYHEASAHWPASWEMIVVPAGSRFADAVRFAHRTRPDEPFYGILDDDYWPVTPGWEDAMLAAAGDRCIAMANNGVHGASIYGCRVMGGALAGAIGTVAPGGMRHNFTDDAWLKIGQTFDLLRPLPHILVEHRHHTFRPEVVRDATYERGSGDFEGDRARFAAWQRSGEFAEQCGRVARLLGIRGVSVLDPRKVRLAICVPIQDVNVDYRFHACLRETEFRLHAAGIRNRVFENFGGSHIGKVRERVLWQAMHHEDRFTHFLFIDADMGWEAKLVTRLLSADHDFCAAVGARKIDELSLCVNALADPQEFHPVTGFWSVRDVGFAFVLLRREAIASMCAAYPDLRYNTGDAPAEFALFLDMIDKDDVRCGSHGERLSEDFSFCRRWRAMGGKVWVDPDAALVHAGRKEYTGSPREWFAELAKVQRLEAAE
jgi:hypothetical protein